MNQLGLPISLNVQMSLANFIANAQIQSAVSQLFNSDITSEIYVYGDPSSGKTHLLQAVIFSAMEQNKTAVFIDCKEEIPDYLVEMVADLEWLSIDNIGAVKEVQQHFLFDLYNRARQANVNIIVSGLSLPADLQIMKDIKTRLNLATVFQLETLNDEQTKDALNNQMSERNMSVDEKVYSYLFKHYSRDIGLLLKAIDRLDEASMQAKQNISIPLAKKILNI
jgi:DnaA family protein